MSASLIFTALADRALRGERRLAYIASADNCGVVKAASVATWCGISHAAACDLIDRMVEEGVFRRLPDGMVVQPALMVHHAHEMCGDRSGPRWKNIPDNVRREVFRRDGWSCHYCGCEESLTLDHKVPRVAGGSDDPENLLTACRSCNSAKGAKSYEDFVAQIAGCV